MRADYEKIETDIILNKLATLFNYLNDFDKIHEKALKDLLIQYDYKNIFNKNLLLSEFHVIDCIGKNQLSNATFISKQLDMTKGAISKILTKLLNKDLIKSNRLEDNKKEIYYTLTSQGKEAFEIHKKLHDIEHQKFVSLLNKYNKEELNTINSFLGGLISELYILEV